MSAWRRRREVAELGSRGEVARTLPILKPQLALVADGLVFAHRSLNDAAMARVRRDPPRVRGKLCGGRAHTGKALTRIALIFTD